MLSKFGLKVAALVLVGTVSAMAQAPMDIDPEDWNYLSNFKLWGTEGISFGNRPEFYDSRLYDREKNENDYSKYQDVNPDTLGWVGTAKGNLATGERGWIDGPIIVGGSVTGERMLSNLSGVNGMVLRKADESELGENELEALTIAMAEASQLPIQFMFTVSTIEDLRSEVQLMSDKGEIDMLIVDYLQLMRSQKNFEKENVRIGYVSKSLKDMAVDFNIPVIALAQVNRDTDGQMPTLKSLKASGDIEQDADGVIFLHKPMNADDEYVYPEDRGAFAAYINQGLTYLCIGIAKQRQGTTGKTCVLFDAAHMRYTAIDREHE